MNSLFYGLYSLFTLTSVKLGSHFRFDLLLIFLSGVFHLVQSCNLHFLSTILTPPYLALTLSLAHSLTCSLSLHHSFLWSVVTSGGCYSSISPFRAHYILVTIITRNCLSSIRTRESFVSAF